MSERIKLFFKDIADCVIFTEFILRNRKTKIYDEAVVFIKLDALGDFVIWLDCAKELKKMYFGKKIILVCNMLYADLAAAVGFFDEVIPIKVSEYLSSAKIIQRRRLNKFFKNYKVEKVIQPVAARNLLMDYIASSIYAAHKITIKGVPDNMKSFKIRYSNILYDEVINVNSEWTMELNRNAEFFRALGFSGFKSSLPCIPKIPIKKNINEDYFILVPGGSRKARLWEIEKFVYIAKKVISMTGWGCYICGSRSETDLAEKICAGLNYKDVNNMAGQTSVTELVEVIRDAQMLISNDTGAAHIAVATDTDVVCIVGGWHYDRFFPYDTESVCGRKNPIVCSSQKDCFRCNYKLTLQCKKHRKKCGKYLCISDITKEQVWKEVEEICKRKLLSKAT